MRASPPPWRGTPVCVPPCPGKAKALGLGRVVEGAGGVLGAPALAVPPQRGARQPPHPRGAAMGPVPPPHGRCRGWQRLRGLSLLPGGGGTGGCGGGTWGSPLHGEGPRCPRHRTRGGHLAAAPGSSPRGGPKGNRPPRPVLQESPKRKSWGRGGGLPAYPRFASQYGSLLGGGAFLPAPHPAMSNRGASSVSGGGGSRRGEGALGEGGGLGGAVPPPNRSITSPRDSHWTQTQTRGVRPPPKPPPRRTPTPPPCCLCPQGESGGHQEALAGVSPPPRWGRGWGGGGDRAGGGEGGPPPRNRCGLRVV